MATDAEGRTVLYLIRHGATEANLVSPPRLQGRRHDPTLAQLGVRQAEATRDFLAVRPIDHCYCSPLLRAVQTAAIVAAPHGAAPQPLEALTECDVGDWEGLDWGTIRARQPDAYRRFHANPAAFGYPGGESFRAVHERVAPALDGLLRAHAGGSLLVVAHHAVNRTYLAGLLGLAAGRARAVALDNCGISVVVRAGGATSVATLNATFHLQGVAA
ncbi:MAG TPA: histidine phosphatase family protein [Gemmataceae bacterium]|jgi:broad specificity phosphatase PhoE|nr:histidine phosphatase family protein [Gemmataceae bacterium]